ncbi:metal ABC transporter ATP-binding protein [Rhizobium halophytocola]|uniref:Zinc/manganese transport system ATP-binding protein n=1 Tax=Rhizobium halophytocola TaxID=735519 RepID=A0ABS4DX74_9HYPH|nr:ABC transporter ATP-binding protein [Rhizobium halophytocola]MBP1850296.1 zinc/manganese transport system ATP-binding protein [Rhizobium halophytocola]
MTPPVLTFDNVTLAYQRHPALHHLSGKLQEGSLTAVAGPNGAGKSTLLKAIIGEVPVSEGRIVHGAHARDIGYLPQIAEINRRFPITVLDTVLMGGWKATGAFGRVGREMLSLARAALEDVGLAGFDYRLIGSLSVGQLQRVLFARLILQDMPVILLDEPFNAIDARTIAVLVEIIAGWHREGRTVLAVLHDMDLIRRHFPETLLLARRPIAWGQTCQALSPDNLAHAMALAEAWDENSEPCRKVS